MSRALFLIDTPSHVFNIKEALSVYQLTDYDLIINDCNRADTFEQLKARIVELNPSKLFEVPRVSGDIEDRIHAYAQYLPILKSRQYRQIFFSSIRQQWQRDIVCSLDKAQHILIDDGNATVVFYDYLFSKKRFFDFPDDPDLDRKKKADEVRARYSISTKELSELELFTFFNLEPMPWLSITKNLLSGLHREHQRIDPNLVYLLGVGAVTVNYISQENYLELLKRTKALLPDKQFCYIPHRIESSELQEEVVKLGFSVQRLNMPVENWLYHCDIAPSTILSYHSTALFTCAAMFPSLRVISVQPDMKIWHNVLESHVWNIKSYNNYQVLETIYKYLNNEKSIVSICL